jgi:hypothetical protein
MLGSQSTHVCDALQICDPVHADRQPPSLASVPESASPSALPVSALESVPASMPAGLRSPPEPPLSRPPVDVRPPTEVPAPPPVAAAPFPRPPEPRCPALPPVCPEAPGGGPLSASEKRGVLESEQPTNTAQAKIAPSNPVQAPVLTISLLLSHNGRWLAGRDLAPQSDLSSTPTASSRRV